VPFFVLYTYKYIYVCTLEYGNTSQREREREKERERERERERGKPRQALNHTKPNGRGSRRETIAAPLGIIHGEKVPPVQLAGHAFGPTIGAV